MLIKDQGGPVPQCSVPATHCAECRNELHTAYSLQAEQEGIDIYQIMHTFTSVIVACVDVHILNYKYFTVSIHVYYTHEI